MKETKNSNTIFRDTEFKDESPLKTVEKIKGILSEYGIETAEIWLESSVPYCFSLRVSVVGTTFGANGKGITKEFALASAYGELMERLQLGYIGSDNVQKDGNFSANDAQSVPVSAQDLLANNYNWYEALSKSLERFTGEKSSPESILMQYADNNGMLSATPYYSVLTKKTEYFPTALRKAVYTANGCAAGNTMEEAIVQAISEIVERNHHIYMCHNNITPPDIPETVVKECNVAYKIISFLRENGFKVIVKDCSLSTKFPVVGVCIINTVNGRYHTHFGAYPIFEIALERALTESFQGRHITKLASFDDFRFDDPHSLNLNMLLNELVKGVSEKFPSFFVGKKQFEYNDNMGFNGKNNKELLVECVDYFKEMGLDILIRDSSCLGFPTYQVLVPGYSEVFAHRLSQKHNDLAFNKQARNALRNLSEAKFEDLVAFLMLLAKKSFFSNLKTFASLTSLSLNFTPQEDAYMMDASLAYTNYSMMKYNESIKHINRMLSSVTSYNEEYLICIKRYLSLLVNNYSTTEIKELLYYFHKKQTVDKLYSFIEADKNPLEEFILHCNGICNKNCILYNSCCQKKVSEIISVINNKTRQLNFDLFVNDLASALNYK